MATVTARLLYIAIATIAALATAGTKVQLPEAKSGGPPAFTLATFPIGTPGVSPYNAAMIAVMDHKARFYQQCCDTEIVAYTGESATRGDSPGLCPAPPGLPTCFVTPNCICEYAHPDGGEFVINGNYVGALFGASYLSYDGHAGYDFRYDFETPLVASADGSLCKAIDDPINGRIGFASAWDKFHTFYIDHGEIEGRGYSSWYLHAERLEGTATDGSSLADLSPGECAPVTAGQVIATVGNQGTFLPHLHFETRVYMLPDGVERATQRGFDPYGWSGSGPDPLSDPAENPQAESRIEATWIACGNGRREGAEVCDDGNVDDGDCCSTTCEAQSGPTCICAGDCNGDGSVAINELVIGVGITLGRLPLERCTSLDTNNDGATSINELITAVGNALKGCN